MHQWQSENIWHAVKNINMLSNDWRMNILIIFGRQNILEVFWTTFLDSLGHRIGLDLKNVQVLHL